jgi:hypothetical protein
VEGRTVRKRGFLVSIVVGLLLGMFSGVSIGGVNVTNQWLGTAVAVDAYDAVVETPDNLPAVQQLNL